MTTHLTKIASGLRTSIATRGLKSIPGSFLWIGMGPQCAGGTTLSDCICYHSNRTIYYNVICLCSLTESSDPVHWADRGGFSVWRSSGFRWRGSSFLVWDQWGGRGGASPKRGGPAADRSKNTVILQSSYIMLALLTSCDYKPVFFEGPIYWAVSDKKWKPVFACAQPLVVYTKKTRIHGHLNVQHSLQRISKKRKTYQVFVFFKISLSGGAHMPS